MFDGSTSSTPLRIQDCDLYFIYVADAGRHLEPDEVLSRLSNSVDLAAKCCIEQASFTAISHDPLYALVRQPPIVMKVDGSADEGPLGEPSRRCVPVSTVVRLWETGFISARLSLALRDVDLDCAGVARALSSNEIVFKVTCPLLGESALTLDQYAWAILGKVRSILSLSPRIPIERSGELDRVVILRKISGAASAEDLLANHARELAAIVGRVGWYEDQSEQFIEDMTAGALVLHRHLLVLSQWFGNLVYYPADLPADVRQRWEDAVLLDLFDMLMVQFCALRMYGVILEERLRAAREALRSMLAPHDTAPDSTVRKGVLESLFALEEIRAEVDTAVHETQNSLVSLSYMVGQVMTRYDRVIRLTDRLRIVETKLANLSRLHDVIIRTLSQETNEALLKTEVGLQEHAAQQQKLLTILTVGLVILTVVLAAGEFRDDVARGVAQVADMIR